MTSLTPYTDEARAVLAALPPPQKPAHRIQSAVREALALATAREADAGTSPQEIADGNIAAAINVLATACVGAGCAPGETRRLLAAISEAAAMVIDSGIGVKLTPIHPPGRPS